MKKYYTIVIIYNDIICDWIVRFNISVSCYIIMLYNMNAPQPMMEYVIWDVRLNIVECSFELPA